MVVSAGSRRPAVQFGCGAIEGRAQAVEQLVDLVVAYDERRADRQGIAEGANDQPLLLGQLVGLAADPQGGVERLLARLVAHQFQRAYKSDAARLANQGMGAETVQPLLEMRGDGAHMVEDGALLIDLQRLDGDRCLATVTMSGFMPNVSMPNMVPSRPKPQITSSATSRTSCLRSTGWILSK